jgi:hypothetical protein
MNRSHVYGSLPCLLKFICTTTMCLWHSQVVNQWHWADPHGQVKKKKKSRHFKIGLWAELQNRFVGRSKSRNFKLGLQRYKLFEVMHERLKKCLLVSIWLDVYIKREKNIQWCKEKNWKLEHKKGSVGVMVSFCVQVQEVHHTVDLCCAFRPR